MDKEEQQVRKLTGFRELVLKDGEQSVTNVISMVQFKNHIVVATKDGVYVLKNLKKWWEFWK